MTPVARPAPSAAAATNGATPKRKEYARPDISLLRSINDSSEQIRQVLKVIGEERSYAAELRVLITQAKLVMDLSGELLERFEARGIE